MCDRTMEMTSEGLTSYLGNYQYYKEKKELLLLLSQKEEEKKIEAKAPQPKKKKNSLSKSKLKVEVEKLEGSIKQINKRGLPEYLVNKLLVLYVIKSMQIK